MTPLELEFMVKAHHKREWNHRRNMALMAQFIRRTMHSKQCPSLDEMVPEGDITPNFEAGEKQSISNMSRDDLLKRQKEAAEFFRKHNEEKGIIPGIKNI